MEKIVWLTEGGFEGKVNRNYEGMRNDSAWMCDELKMVIHHVKGIMNDTTADIEKTELTKEWKNNLRGVN